MDAGVTISRPHMAPMQEEATALRETARTIAMTDAASFAAAGALLVRLKGLRTKLEQLFAPHIKRAFASHRALLDDRRRLDAPLAQAEAILKGRLAAFTRVEEERRRIDAHRLAAEAQEARTARIWAEVEDLEEAGYPDEAADLVTDLVSAPPVLVAIPPPLTADGISRRELWRYAVTDETQVPREYLTIDHVKLGGVVRALKSAAQIPGVRIWAERTIAATGR